jgi:hypothetical protein
MIDLLSLATYPNEESFLKGIKEIITVLDDSQAQQKWLPCILLMFSTIDGLSYIIHEPSERTSEHFKRWCNKWLLPFEGTDGNADDLWAARSGAIHRLSLASDLYFSGKARGAIWSTKNEDDSIELVKEFRDKIEEEVKIKLSERKFFYIHFQSFYKAFLTAVGNFLDDCHQDKDLWKKYASYLDISSVARL